MRRLVHEYMKALAPGQRQNFETTIGGQPIAKRVEGLERARATALVEIAPGLDAAADGSISIEPELLAGSALP
jgi:hypothetical protein